jgi:hypothetical protein
MEEISRQSSIHTVVWLLLPTFISEKSEQKSRSEGLDFEHMIKARAHKGGVRIGKTPKKLATICCP